MSCKVLANCSKSPRKNPSFFYKPQEIRFKSLINIEHRRASRQQYVISNNPWISLKGGEVSKLIDRLEDRPEQLYQAIQRRQQHKKFTLLKVPKQKQNLRLLREIEAKKRAYQAQFRELLNQSKSQTLNIFLPKLQRIRYVYKDDLHCLQSSSSGLQKR